MPEIFPPRKVPPPVSELFSTNPTPLSTVSDCSRLYESPDEFGVATFIVGTPVVVCVIVGVKRIGAVGSVIGAASAC